MYQSLQRNPLLRPVRPPTGRRVIIVGIERFTIEIIQVNLTTEFKGVTIFLALLD